jgi:dTDP-glucose pyrophosphorylase
MAGLGQRFRQAGYTLPKPLIPLSGVPMVVRAVQDLPAAERITFLVHSDHVREHAIDRALTDWFPHARVVATPGLTAGQACTVRLSSAVVAWDEEVLVAACDNTHLYDAAKFAALRLDPTIDAIIWTYRRDERVLIKPTAHGWVQCRPPQCEKAAVGTRSVTATCCDVAAVSCKRPISDRPMEDHAITGCFWFRRAGRLYEAIDELVASNQRVNGEFYLDQVPNIYVQGGLRVVVFEVEKYIGWGTPHDLEDYRAWERYFARRAEQGGAAWRSAA